jgi:hypothetical protein
MNFDETDIVSFQNEIEYSISEYISFIYNREEHLFYFTYVDDTTGDEVEEVIDYFEDRTINGVLVSERDFNDFAELIRSQYFA